MCVKSEKKWREVLPPQKNKFEIFLHEKRKKKKKNKTKFFSTRPLSGPIPKFWKMVPIYLRFILENLAFCPFFFFFFIHFERETRERGKRKKPMDSNANGYVGLKNEGTSDILNTVIQALYHLPSFRQLVYDVPRQEESGKKEISLIKALQRLFYRLDYSQEKVFNFLIFLWLRDSLL